MRELHARCVKISRAARNQIFAHTVFIGIFSEKPVGIGSAKEFPECVLTAGVLSVRPACCQPNEIKN